MMLREPWRTRLLFISFAVNLLIIPIAAAPHLFFHRPSPPGPARTEMVIEHMMRDLPPADAERFRAGMMGHVAEIEAARGRMIEARAAMSQAIGRSPFDEAAVRTAMLTWKDCWNRWSEALGGAMLESLPALSDEGRHKLADAGRRPPTR